MKYIDLNKKHTSRWYHRNENIKLNTLKPKTWATIGLVLIAFLILIGASWFDHAYAEATDYDNNYFVKKAIAIDEPIASTPEKEEIKAFVRQVFGTHSDKAFRVLSCENSALNPKAVNGAGNFPEGSLDLGLFQINNHWQKIENKAFLFDYKVNTMIAYNIFSRDGYSFKLWTCGRKLGV